MIRQNDQARLAPVPRTALQGRPESPQRLIKIIRRLEDPVVAPLMPPVIGLRQGHVKELRLLALEVLISDRQGNPVMADGIPGRSQPELGLVGGHHPRSKILLGNGLETRVAENRAFHLRGDGVKDRPGADGRDLFPWQLELPAHVLEDRLTRTGNSLVALDGCLRLASHDLGVARIGKMMRVRDLGIASQRPVAEHHALLRQGSPEKRQQGLPPQLRRLPPVLFFKPG